MDKVRKFRFVGNLFKEQPSSFILQPGTDRQTVYKEKIYMHKQSDFPKFMLLWSEKPADRYNRRSLMMPGLTAPLLHSLKRLRMLEGGTEC